MLLNRWFILFRKVSYSLPSVLYRTHLVIFQITINYLQWIITVVQYQWTPTISAIQNVIRYTCLKWELVDISGLKSRSEWWIQWVATISWHGQAQRNYPEALINTYQLPLIQFSLTMLLWIWNKQNINTHNEGGEYDHITN